MAKTLNDILNAALKEIGEPEITGLTSGNLFQLRLIEATNNAVRTMLDRMEYDWLRKRTTLATVAKITTEKAAVTKGSTTVTCVDDDGANAANWASVAAGQYFRVSGTQKSYVIASTSVGSTPHTLTLETAYLDSTSTAAGYRIFQDTYSITDTDFDTLSIAAYGDARSWTTSLGASQQLGIVTVPELYNRSGGDPHRDTSGRAFLVAQQAADSDNQTQFKFWPYFDDTFLIELWYMQKFTDATSLSTTIFGGDAPLSAYDAVEHKVVAAACLWDEDPSKASVFEQKGELAILNVIRRENRERIDVGMDVETYRRSYGVRSPTRSGITFDTGRRR